MQRKYEESQLFLARFVVATHIIRVSIIRKELVSQEWNEPLTFPLKNMLPALKLTGFENEHLTLSLTNLLPVPFLTGFENEPRYPPPNKVITCSISASCNCSLKLSE